MRADFPATNYFKSVIPICVVVLLGIWKHSLRAQSTIETMLILAAGIAVLTTLVSIVYTNIGSGVAAQQQNQGYAALRELVVGINDAYFMGPGTVKESVIVLPDGTDLNRSYMRGKALVLNVDGSDLSVSADVNVVGSWPNSSGSYVFTITAGDSFVYVSTQPLSFSPPVISQTVAQNSSKDVNVAFTNVTSSSLSYSVVLGLSGDANVTYGYSQPSPFTLAAGAGTSLIFTLACSKTSSGAYSGLVALVPSVSTDANLALPVRIVCSSAQPKLAVLPSSKSISASPNSSSSDSVIVCNSSPSDFSPVSSAISGDAARYVFTSFSSTISANSCSSVPLSVKSGGAGTYLGKLSITGGGFSADANITLSVA